MTWRRKWARTWDEVRYCSDRCRTSAGRVGESGTTAGNVIADPRIEAALLELLATRCATVTICPSEVARALWPSTRSGVDPWREKMPEVHAAATRLALAGTIEITQGGEVVDPALVRGARRLRRGPAFPA